MIDQVLGGALSPALRLIVWATLSSVLAMGAYRLLSSQAKLTELKRRIALIRAEVQAYDGDFAGVQQLLKRWIGLSLRQVGITLGPSVVASLPLLFVIAWLSNAYSYDLPAPGDLVAVTVTPAGSETRWQGAGRPAAETNGQVAWPDGRLELVDVRGTRLLALPPAGAVPVIHKRGWWNRLFGNPLGYLPDTTSVESVRIGLPRRRYFELGPAWLGYWETIYFALLIALSLGIKTVFRIQ